VTVNSITSISMI